MAYTNEGKVENYLQIDIDASLSDYVTSWITATQRWIDNYTGKSFEQASETRYFDGSGKRELDIDDCISITTFQTLDSEGNVDDTLTEGASNDFLLYPYNETPKYIVKLSDVASIGSFPSGIKNIKIVGVWGHSATVPSDIELAATILVGNIVKEGLKGGKPSSESLGDYNVAYHKVDETADAMAVKSILNQYRDIKIY